MIEYELLVKQFYNKQCYYNSFLYLELKIYLMHHHHHQQEQNYDEFGGQGGN